MITVTVLRRSFLFFAVRACAKSEYLNCLTTFVFSYVGFIWACAKSDFQVVFYDVRFSSFLFEHAPKLISVDVLRRSFFFFPVQACAKSDFQTVFYDDRFSSLRFEYVLKVITKLSLRRSFFFFPVEAKSEHLNCFTYDVRFFLFPVYLSMCQKWFSKLSLLRSFFSYFAMRFCPAFCLSRASCSVRIGTGTCFCLSLDFCAHKSWHLSRVRKRIADRCWDAFCTAGVSSNFFKAPPSKSRKKNSLVYSTLIPSDKTPGREMPPKVMETP